MAEAEGGCKCFQEQHPEVLNHSNCPLERLCSCNCFAFHTEEQAVGGVPGEPEEQLLGCCCCNGPCDGCSPHRELDMLWEMVTQVCIPVPQS